MMELIYQLFFLFGISIVYQVNANVYELDSSNFEKFRKSSRFTLVFVDSNYTECTRCKQMFPFFLAASQMFEEDREITFGRVHGHKLITGSKNKHFPVVFYYPPESKTAKRMYGDITVDNIMETIADNMYGYFGDSKNLYSIEVDDKSFDEIILHPTQYVMLLLYDKSCEETVTMINEAAEAFRNDEEVIFCKLNADKYKKYVGKNFKLREPPKIFWYHFKLKEERKTFGGGLSTPVLISFVNENLHLYRSSSGRLTPLAGRIKEMDAIIVKYINAIYFGFEENLGGVIGELESFKTDSNLPWEKNYAEYYVSILKRAAQHENLHFLEKERDELIIAEADGSLSNLEKDSNVRKLNVIAFLFETLGDYIAKYVSKDELKQLEKDKRRRQRQKKKQKKAAKLKKIHIHEEL